MTNAHEHKEQSEGKAFTGMVKTRKRGCRAGANQRKNWSVPDKKKAEGAKNPPKSAKPPKRPSATAAAKPTKPVAGTGRLAAGPSASTWRGVTRSAGASRAESFDETFSDFSVFRKDSFDSFSTSSSESSSPRNSTSLFASFGEAPPTKRRFILVPVQTAQKVEVARHDKPGSTKTVFLTNMRPRSASDASTSMFQAAARPRPHAASVCDPKDLTVQIGNTSVLSQPVGSPQSVLTAQQVRELRADAPEFEPKVFLNPSAQAFEPSTRKSALAPNGIWKAGALPSTKEEWPKEETSTPRKNSVVNEVGTPSPAKKSKVRRGKRSPEKRVLRKELFLKKTAALKAAAQNTANLVM